MSSESSQAEAPSDALVLDGLAGDNPLAFLAALGTLRMLAGSRPERRVRMSWRWDGAWRPALHFEGDWSRSGVVDALDDGLRGRDRAPEFTLAAAGEVPRELTLSPQEYADAARQAARRATLTDRVWADFCAAYGSDAFADQPSLQDTALRFTSGQQSFLGSIRELAGEPPAPAVGRRRSAPDEGGGTAARHIDHALFEPWSYADPRPSLRWDPIDDRRYALRAFDPTNAAAAPIRTVRGANRLAIEALPWLPSFPTGGAVATRGFLRRGREMTFCWPVWAPALSAVTVASLLGLAEIAFDPPPRRTLRPRGVVEVFRSRRVGGYYRNFAPGVACWGRTAVRVPVDPAPGRVAGQPEP